MSSLLVFKRVYRLEIQSAMLVFSTPLVNYCRSTLLTGLSPPLPRVNKYRSMYFYSVVTGGVRRSGCVESIYINYTLCI
jgi:hypothetical protein